MVMANFYLPIDSSPDNTQRIQLGDNTYDFRFRWNSKEGAWYCYLGLTTETSKVKFKMVTGMDLLKEYRAYEEVPQGALFMVDLDQIYGRPGRDNIGQDSRFRVLFIGE